MKCPKCGYISFDFNDTCPKCNRDLSEVKGRLHIPSFKPVAINWLEEISPTLEEKETLEKPITTPAEEKEEIELETISLESLEIESEKKEEEEKEIELEPLDLESLEIELEEDKEKK